MTDFVDPIVIAQINGAKDELVAEVAKLQPAVTKIENYAGSLGDSIPEAPLDGKTYGRKDANWIEVSGGGGGDATWGNIVGVLSDQADLQTELDLKANDNSISIVGKTGNYNDLIGKPSILPEAPNDGKQYARKNLGWAEVTATIPTNPVLNGTTNFKNGASGNVFTDIDTGGESFGFQSLDAFDNPFYRGFICDSSGMAIYVGGSLWGRVFKGNDVPPSDNKQYVRKNQAWSELAAVGGTGFDAIYAQSTQLTLSGTLDLGGGPRYTVPSATVEAWANKRVYITATPTNFSTLKIFTIDATPASLPLGTVIILDIRGDVVKAWDRFEFSAPVETANLRKFDETILTSAMTTVNMHVELVLTQHALSTKKWIARSIIIN